MKKWILPLPAWGWMLGLLMTSIPVSAQEIPDERNAALPNIIFIFADDLGYGDISSFGSETIKTPNIDSLAADGIKFNDFYSASPVCSPARAALLTGRYPSRMGIRHVFMADSPEGMPTSEITIAEQLKTVGYTTGLVGKWHLGHQDRFMPWNQGFDEFYGVPYSNDMGNFFFYDNKEMIPEPIDQRYLTQRYTEKSLDFIERHQEQPFFLYLAHSMPHVPLYASPEFEGKSEGGLYGDTVEEMDWSTGQVLQKLESLGLTENTIVVFSSDNGPWLMMGDEGGSAGPLRDGKGVTFEGGQRVPTLAKWPAQISPGREYSNTASMLDWFPTFSAIAGVPLPDDREIDGKDLSELLTADADIGEGSFFYLASFSSRPVAYREGPWKLKMPRKGYPEFLDSILKINVYSHGTLLFNLEEDPGETTNLADQYPERVAQMQAAIESFDQEIESANIRLLYMKGTGSDKKGYGHVISNIALVAIPLLILVIAILYGAYRLLKKLVRKNRNSSEEENT